MSGRLHLKKIIPEFLHKIYRDIKLKKSRRLYNQKSTQDVFTEIYKKNLWGGNKNGEFCSGSGSKEEYAKIYADQIKTFINKNCIKTIIDLGCGDFNVGYKIIDKNIHYTGIDIVEDLIIENERKFSTSNVKFICKNIISDELPDGDLCLIRQVFQHLSNDQILRVIKKFKNYKYIIITEHYPSNQIKKIIPNKDKPHGPDTRIYDNSAVFLDKTPFNLKNINLLFEIKLKDCLVRKGETLKTFLVKNTQNQF